MSSQKIEDFMNRADEWDINSFDAQSAVDQHASSARDAEVIEVDADSAPDEARKSAEALAKQERGQRQSKKKKLVALGAIAAVVVMAVALAAMMRPKAAAPVAPVSAASEASVVQSQFSPPPVADQALPSAQEGGMGASSAQGGAAAAPASPAAATASPAASPPQQSTPAASAPDQEAQAQLKAKQEELARLERENKELKERLAREAQQRAASASASPNRYGSDVYRIYPDGIVLINARGEQVPVAIGEVARKYGRLIKTDPESRTFVTDRGTIRPEK